MAKVLTTRIAFSLDGESDIYRAESVIRFQDDGDSWRHYTFRQEPGAIEVGAVRTDDGFERNTLPSYGEFMLLIDMISSGASSEQYWRIRDSEPSATPASAEIRCVGIERVEVLDGPQDCRRYDVLSAGNQVGCHWASSDGLVRSDWNGPMSFPQSKEVVLTDLDPIITEFLINGY